VYLEVLSAVVSVVAGIALVFRLGPVQAAANGTSISILGAAVLALGLRALGVARDPVRCSSVLMVQLIFATISALALAWKFAGERSLRALYLLVPLAMSIVSCYRATPRNAARWAAPTSRVRC
jgi:hypothetical protein